MAFLDHLNLRLTHLHPSVSTLLSSTVLESLSAAFLGLFIICLLHYSVSSITAGYLAVLLYLHHAEQCLAHSRHSINICGMSKHRCGEPSQYAEWLDEPVAWGGSYSLCLCHALGKQASFCPDSHCLRTVCRQTDQAWAATLRDPRIP